VMLTMLQMESRLAKGDDPSLNAKVCDSSRLPTVTLTQYNELFV